MEMEKKHGVDTGAIMVVHRYDTQHYGLRFLVLLWKRVPLIDFNMRLAPRARIIPHAGFRAEGWGISCIPWVPESTLFDKPLWPKPYTLNPKP